MKLEGKYDINKVRKMLNVLTTGKQILDLYEGYNCPTRGKKYHSFVYHALKIVNEAEDHNLEGYADWLFGNEGNELPNSSSGSLYTALQDYDNLMAGCGLDEPNDPSEFEFELFDMLYKALINVNDRI